MISSNDTNTVVNILIQCIHSLDSNTYYRNRKELLDAINYKFDMAVSYGSFKGHWQRNSALDNEIKSKLVSYNLGTYSFLEHCDDENIEYESSYQDNEYDKHNINIFDNEFYQDFIEPYQLQQDIKFYNENKPVLTGITAIDQTVDPQETFLKMMEYWDKTNDLYQRKSEQKISFTAGPICLVNTADTHFGGAVDVKRVFNELDCILDTPNMYVNYVGDLSNNFIGSWTKKINHNKPFTIEEEQAISKYYLQKISAKLLAVVPGNHNNFSQHEAGIDVIKSYLNDLGCQAFYDMHENVFTLEVAGRKSVIRSRHIWQGNSSYNDTHAIEKAAKFDQAIPFDIGVGAHTHRSGLYREFNNGGKTGVAILCGTYKTIDDYAFENGFTKANKSTAVCVILDPDSESFYHGVSDVFTASKIMKCLMK